LFVVVLKPAANGMIGTSSGMVFALLVAWDRVYRNERLILAGIGEISVRQAVLLVALIDSVILFFCSGWFLMLAMWFGGAAGWVYFAARGARLSSRGSQPANSERIARLEL